MEEQQSVDSAQPGFVMPDDWHWRKVDASNVRDTDYGFRLIGWDASGQAQKPYCVTDEHDFLWWVEHIRFVDGDTCDWSDDDTGEPC